VTSESGRWIWWILVAVNNRGRALISARAAYVAGYTDRRVLADNRFGTSHAVPISFEEFKGFASKVWGSEHRTEPLYVSRTRDLPTRVQDGELRDAAAAARWATPPADAWGMPRTGALAGTTGPVAYIDVHDEGLLRLVALHEIAHLFCDTLDATAGHDMRWAAAYEGLVGSHLGVPLAVLWRLEFDWWNAKAVEKIADDPDWLAGMVEGPELPSSLPLSGIHP
jgi:hypothetical protein